MIALRHIIAVACVLLFAGCGKRDVASPADADAVAERLQEIVKRLTSDDPSVSGYDDITMEMFRVLKHADLKSKRLSEFTDAILSVRIDGLPYRKQTRIIGLVRNYIESASMRCSRDELSWELRYDIDLRLLSWERDQILRVQPFARKNNNGMVVITDLAKEDEQCCCDSIYHSGIRNYESRVASLESFFWVNRKHMTEAEEMRIRERIEKYLGRRVRTEDQIREDRSKNRYVEFPKQSGS